MPRILLLDDHALVRRGVRDVLEDAGLEVVGEGDCCASLEALLSHTADVLVLDLQLPDGSGLDVLERLQGRAGSPAAVVFSMHPADQYASRVLRAGAHAYVCKSCDASELLAAVRAAAAARAAAAGSASPTPNRLSGLEHALLSLIASGHALADISQQLAMTPRATAVHRARLLQKLKAAGNADLAQYARTHGIGPA